MSTRNKLQKFAELLEMPNVYENYNAKEPALTASEDLVVDFKGRWAGEHFNNDNPIILELACGRGEYTLALAEACPDCNFIGVDIKGARIWQGATKALNQKRENVAFLRTRIEMITHFFAADEVDEIWITFPDPFLRKSKVNRRLTCAMFLDRYRTFLKNQGKIHLKTDNTPLYEFTLETWKDYPHMDIIHHESDIYSGSLYLPELAIKTYYEGMHLSKGLKIKYVQGMLS